MHLYFIYVDFSNWYVDESFNLCFFEAKHSIEKCHGTMQYNYNEHVLQPWTTILTILVLFDDT